VKAFRVKVKAEEVPGGSSAYCGGDIWGENELGAPCFCLPPTFLWGQNRKRRAFNRAALQERAHTR